MKTVNQMIDNILQREGGYVNDPTDRGGATNYGVTIGTYSRYLGYKASIAQVKAMNINTARDIYKRNYYEQPRLHLIHGGIQPQLFDCFINHGSKNPIKWLQKITNQALNARLKLDGMLGHKTAEATNHFVELAGGKIANNAMVEERTEFYLRLIRRQPSQVKFKRGWLKRAKEFEQ